MGDVVQFRRAPLTGFIPEKIETAERRDLIAHAKSGSPTIIMHDDNIVYPPCDTEPPGAA